MARRGGNRVSDYDRVVCYGDPAHLPGAWPVAEGGGSTVLEVHTPDPWLGRYGPVVPFCQAFVDLFNTPGWPAARFIERAEPEKAPSNSGTARGLRSERQSSPLHR